MSLAIMLAAATVAHAQTQPAERVSFTDAILRAVEKNPSLAIAAASILRAEALIADARSGTRLQINGTVTTTTLNRGVEFEGTTVSPRNQLAGALDVRMPLYAPARWARRAQAQDQRNLAELSVADTRRQTALATADAYLTIIAQRRVVEANERARDVARAHFDLARELEQRGTGSRLNQVRAEQEVSIDEGLVESARLALFRAQEALGVLLVADGPVDAIDEPAFDVPPDAPVPGSAPVAPGTPAAVGSGPQSSVGSGFSRTEDAQLLQFRSDLRLFAAQQQAAERVLRDSSKDFRPYLEAVFQPQSTYPSQFFVPANSWRFLLQLSVPLIDGGQRTGLRFGRQAALDVSRATFTRALTEVRSEVRAAREAVQSGERGLISARAAADQAQEVVNIVNISFRAGAATNIEVIDAERRARDADTAAAVAEDTLRRARLELLVALGRFPN